MDIQWFVKWADTELVLNSTKTPFVSYVIKKGNRYGYGTGMVFTIEPMINAGYPDVYVDDDNGWTIYTEDDSYSAQWEIMVHVTDDGYEVMTY